MSTRARMVVFKCVIARFLFNMVTVLISAIGATKKGAEIGARRNKPSLAVSPRLGPGRCGSRRQQTSRTLRTVLVVHQLDFSRAFFAVCRARIPPIAVIRHPIPSNTMLSGKFKSPSRSRLKIFEMSNDAVRIKFGEWRVKYSKA